MAVFAHIRPPSQPGRQGLRVPADDAVAAETLRLARALVESRPASQAFLENFSGAWPTDPCLTFGPVEEDVAWSQVARLLTAPPEPLAPWSVSWSIRGCEVRIENWTNDEPQPIVAINVRLPGDIDTVARALEVAAGEPLSPCDEEGHALALTTSGVSSRLFDYSPDERDSLYGDEDHLGHREWLRTRISEAPGLWDVLYPSSPVLRPSSGGFLEFFAGISTRTRGLDPLFRAIREHGIGGLRRWFVVRWAIPVGHCALPAGAVVGPRVDVLDFLHDPASLDSGSVTMEAWSGAVAYEWEHRRRIGWRRVWGPGYLGVTVSDSFAARIGYRRARVRILTQTGYAGSGRAEVTWGP